ncbi:MAG: hypothetical protein PWP15_883 [Methanothermococcus sp.]|jgi:hypothetical protein|uniref:hypothetical protein n=1 Tax=Methanothermococcus TaxID=155862 RepID=UPI000367241C|nr:MULTISPECIES: hypothetical protein [Methanothermococcus]MDK2790376.1 hypothetical protein [Methanothermococcus sp.]MDK2987513.1 hypothetical protein [Methanothermococcus sp.]
MGICLICTLGNRDIQFKKEFEHKLKETLGDILDKNNDLDSNELYIKKGNFLDNTRKILEKYNHIQDHITLPIIQSCLNKHIEKIILIPTNQQDENIDERFKKGDTFIEAEIIKKVLEKKGYLNKVEIKVAKFDASNLERWFNHIHEIINNNYKKFDKLIFEISGGVPTSKEAIRLASLFKNKTEVAEVVNGEVSPANMGFFENRIIKEKVKDLIRNYNYTGALSFKKYYEDDEEVLKLIKHLNYRLNFDFDNAVKYYNEERLKKLRNESNTIKKLEYLILELLDNMEIELKNGNYANFLARVYRLEEAMGQYFVLKWFEKTKTEISYKLGNNPPSGFVNVKNIGVEDLNNKIRSYLRYLSNGIKFNKPVNHKGVSKLRSFIEENCKKKDRSGNIITRNGKVEYNICINTPTYKKLIGYLYGYYSSELRTYEKIQKMYKKNYNNLRHTTIVAHGFEGINNEKIRHMLKLNGINEDINKYFKSIKSEFFNIVNKDEINIFDKLNNEIINNL